MQQSPLLTALQLLVMVGVVIVAGLLVFQYLSVEEKMVRTHDQVSSLDNSVSELKRTVERMATETARARDASQNTERRLNELTDLARQGALVASGSDATSDSDSTNTSSELRREDRSSAPSTIAGIEVYPYRPGWTVLCDSRTNADPKRDLPPEDQIDWDATMNDYASGEPKGLNFYSDDRTVTVSSLSYYVFDPVAERKTTNVQEWNAKLAERVEESPDSREYIIYVRKNIFWHQPEPAMVRDHPWIAGERPITGRDIKFTLDLLRNPQTSTPLKVYYQDIESVELIDEYTVHVTWKRRRFYNRQVTLEVQPYPEFIWAFDRDGNRYPEPDVYAQFGKHWFGKSMCGSGPYRFVEYKRGEFIRCVRNNNYYGDRPTCREYYVQIIADSTARLAAFWNQRITFTILVPEQYRSVILEARDDTPVYEYENPDQPAPAHWNHVYRIWRRQTYGGFGWNMRKPLFQDKRVRKALTLSLNRAAVPEQMYYGLGETLAIGESVFSPYFNDQLPVLPFDLEQAARLLSEAGWEDTDGDGIRDKILNETKTDCSFQLLVSSSSAIQKQICQMYKEDLLKIGVQLEPNPAEAALWSRQIHDRAFDGFIIFWTAAFDSDPKQLWDSATVDDIASNNYTGFANAEADEIFAKLETTFDYPTRIQLMHRWYEIEYDEQPYTWIWTVHSPFISHADWRMPEPRQTNPYMDRRLMFRWKNRP